MAEAQFKKGDVVELKSGGPKMTVTQVGAAMMTSGITVWFVWFEGSKKFEDTFPPETLTPG